MGISNWFPTRLPKYNWGIEDGVADEDFNSIEETLENITALLLLNDAYAGRSVTIDWDLVNTLCNWQKFWSGVTGTGNLIKQIDYVYDADKLCQTESFTFRDYKEDGTLLRTRTCVVTYTWDTTNKLCTGIDVGTITTI